MAAVLDRGPRASVPERSTAAPLGCPLLTNGVVLSVLARGSQHPVLSPDERWQLTGSRLELQQQIWSLKGQQFGKGESEGVTKGERRLEGGTDPHTGTKRSAASGHVVWP